MRRLIFFLLKTVSILLAACFLFEIPLNKVGQVSAAEKEYYISEIKIFQGKTEAEARSACENEGYVCSAKELNSGTGKDYVFLGYKLTENRDEALYDIKLLHMNGGYQIKNFAEASEEMEKSNYGAAETMNESANEFVINYKDGSPKAIEAYEGLNLFSVPEADNMKLGDYIVQGKADTAFFAKIITHASTGTVGAITNYLSTGLTPLDKETDEKTGEEVDVTWAGNIKKSGLWNVIEDEDASQDELTEYDKELGDDAGVLFKQLQLFATGYENGLAVYDEEQFISEVKNTSVEEVVNNVDKVSENDNAVTFVNSYNFLNTYEAYEGMPLGEFFVNIGKQTTEEVDLRKLYPVIESMTVAQRKMLGMVGLVSMISNLGKNEKNKQVDQLINESKKKIQEGMGTETISVWFNTDPDMANKKVAFTSDFIRIQAAGQLLNEETMNGWEEAKKQANNVMKYVSILSSGVTVLTFLAGKYGIAGVVVALTKTATSVVGTALNSFFTTVMTISAKVSAVFGWISLGVLAVTLIWYLVSYLVDYFKRHQAKEYTDMPDYVLDIRTINGNNTNVQYRAVKDNKNRIADLNGYEAQNGWVCVYISTDPNAGSPLKADEHGNVFHIVYGDPNRQKGYDCASFFGQVMPGNCNTGAKKDEVNGIYINYYTEKSLKNRSSDADPESGTEIGDGTKQYYMDFVVASGKTAELAKSKIIKKGGYQIIDQNLSPDARESWADESQFTYIGFKTTTDPKLAVRDIRVATNTPKGSVKFGEITYACAGTLGFPADNADENEKFPEDLDGLFFTSNEKAGTPIEVGKLHLVTDHSQAEPGWEAVTTFSGLPYNFNTTRYNDRGKFGAFKPGRLHVYNFSYTGYVTNKSYTWDNTKTYLYYEPEVKYTEGTKYLSGIFFGFGTDSDMGKPLANISDFFDTLSAIPGVEEADGSKGVNLAQSYFYKGYSAESNQKYLHLYYCWSYNPYRAITDVQIFRGEPYLSSLPYTIDKALTYSDKAASSAATSASYVAATVVAERHIVTDWIIRGISPENAYMAPNGLLGMNDQVSRGYTREDQGNFNIKCGQMALLPTNLYVCGYVKDHARLTLDDIVISQNRHDGTSDNGTITCDVSGELTLGGNTPEGDFCSVQDMKDPYELTAFNLSYPEWADDECTTMTEEEGKKTKIFTTDLISVEIKDEYSESVHKPGPSVFMYVKKQVIRKKYIARIFVGSSTRDAAKSTNKDVLANYDKQVDLNAMVAATSAASDEVLLYNMAGEPEKAWYNYVLGGEDPTPPSGGNPAAYLGLVRTDDPKKAITGIMLYQSDAKYVPEQMQFDNAVYYCASNSAPIRMANNKDYFVYYSYNIGVSPGKPITELDLSEEVFLAGHATVLAVDMKDKTEIKNGKIVTTERAKPFGDASMLNFIHAKYELTSSTYFNKIYTASGDTPKAAQLELLAQGCTDFCDIDLNRDAGGKSVYFGYRGFNDVNEAIYDIVCTVGEEFHPEGILSDRYQLYYSPVAKIDKSGQLIGTNLNEGTTGPEIYMYYTSASAVQSYNNRAKKVSGKKLSTMPKDYLSSPVTRIAFAQYDYVPYTKNLEAASSGLEENTPWEYVMNSNNKTQVDLNEGAVQFDDDHLMKDNRVTMFVQRESGVVKPSAEITGGYTTALVAESKLFINK